jgi:hypothetical protein
MNLKPDLDLSVFKKVESAKLGRKSSRERKPVSSPSLRAKAKQSRVSREALDRFVAEPVIGPRVARTRWLLAMTALF